MVVLLFICLTYSLEMQDQTRYQYVDGNGNHYRVSTASIEYMPVAPAESSSGRYSGGEQKSVRITSDQYNKVQQLFEQALQNQAVHQNEREKMTGMVVKSTNGESVTVILKKGCQEKAAIEQYLRDVFEQ